MVPADFGGVVDDDKVAAAVCGWLYDHDELTWREIRGRAKLYFDKFNKNLYIGEDGAALWADMGRVLSDLVDENKINFFYKEPGRLWYRLTVDEWLRLTRQQQQSSTICTTTTTST